MSLNLGLLTRFTGPCPTTNLLANAMPNISVSRQFLRASDEGVREAM